MSLPRTQIDSWNDLQHSLGHLQRRVLREFKIHPGMTASECADVMAMEKATVTARINELLRAGLLTSPHNKLNKKTGKENRAYYPVVELPRVIQRPKKSNLEARIAELEARIARLERAE